MSTADVLSTNLGDVFDNASSGPLDEISKMRYHTERQTSIEKIVNDVFTPPMNSDEAENENNAQSISPQLTSDIDLNDFSNLSPLSSFQQHPDSSNISHPYFRTLDNKQAPFENSSNDKTNTSNNEKITANATTNTSKPMPPINISSNVATKTRIHYSNTPNILRTQYANNGFKFDHESMVKDDLYYLEYGQRQNKFFSHTQSSYSPQHSHSHRLSMHPLQTRSHHGTPNAANGGTTSTSPLTPHSIHTAQTAIHSPQSVHSSHTPHTPHSMNHAFPRFTPYSNHNQAQSTVSTAISNSTTTPQSASFANKPSPKEELVTAASTNNAPQQHENEQQQQQPPQQHAHSNDVRRANKYESDGLSPTDVEAVLSELEIRPDTLRDSSTDFRPVFSCIRPIVCHKSNTPFYAQCSTAKLGYCTWCRQLRRGNQKQGSICLNCGERLTAKYHRWYPHLVRLEPLDKTRNRAMYVRYKPVFERFGITWHNEKQFEFVLDHYMLMKIYLSTQNFNIDALHLERTYMIGVFAGREFNTGALARKLLREGSKLAMFRADFPDYYDFLRDERAAVAEQMNLRFFQGNFQCYFHAHYTNIEGWYDPSVLSRESIIEKFKDLCKQILNHTALAHINQNGKKRANNNHNNGRRKYHKQRNNNNNHHKRQNANNNPHRPQPPPQQQQQQQPVMNMLQNGISNMNIPIVPNMLPSMNAMNKHNQLLAGTQSMLNGISAIPQLNQLSVGNMTSITPIAKVKSFQFNNPNVTNAQSQISPQFLPALATTPRFTVPTPRNNQYHGINLNGVNMNNGSTTFQIPSSLLKNTNAKKEEHSDEDAKNGNALLNARALPFALNAANSIISPRQCSPSNLKHSQFVPPHPHSFGFPPPPIQQSSNWLPVNMNNSIQISPQQPMNLSPMVRSNQFGMNPMNANPNQQSPSNVSMIRNRASPLFAPNQSPQLQPFSH